MTAITMIRRNPTQLMFAIIVALGVAGLSGLLFLWFGV